METQLWWIYDIITLAVISICIYLGGKKGIFKSAVVFISCIIGLVIAIPISGSISENIYKITIRENNINKINKSITGIEISSYLGNAIENMDYNVIVNTQKIDTILESENELDEQLYIYLNNINGKVVDNETNFKNNLYECYCEVLEEIVSKDLSKYAIEIACQKIKSGETDFGNLLKMIKEGSQFKEVSQIIADDYTSDAYKNIIRVLSCTIISTIILITGILTAKSLSGSRREIDESTGSHIIGGVCGIFSGITIVFIIALILRLYAIAGNNESLFFNNKSIDKTLIFSYAYDIASKL